MTVMAKKSPIIRSTRSVPHHCAEIAQARTTPINGRSGHKKTSRRPGPFHKNHIKIIPPTGEITDRRDGSSLSQTITHSQTHS
jgi:hypothetical protein